LSPADKRTVNLLILNDPLPNLPPGGKELRISLAPMGETGKGVYYVK